MENHAREAAPIKGPESLSPKERPAVSKSHSLDSRERFSRGRALPIRKIPSWFSKIAALRDLGFHVPKRNLRRCGPNIMLRHELSDIAKRVSRVENDIGYTFENKMLCIEALTADLGEQLPLHWEGNIICRENNTRLAQFGDRILQMVVCDLWFETRLSPRFYFLLFRQMETRGHLETRGKELGLDKSILTHYVKEEKPKLHVVAEAVEAIIAAVYKDSNRDLGAVKSVVRALGITSDVRQLAEKIGDAERLDKVRGILQMDNKRKEDIELESSNNPIPEPLIRKSTEVTEISARTKASHQQLKPGYEIPHLEAISLNDQSLRNGTSPKHRCTDVEALPHLNSRRAATRSDLGDVAVSPSDFVHEQKTPMRKVPSLRKLTAEDIPYQLQRSYAIELNKISQRRFKLKRSIDSVKSEMLRSELLVCTNNIMKLKRRYPGIKELVRRGKDFKYYPLQDWNTGGVDLKREKKGNPHDGDTGGARSTRYVSGKQKEERDKFFQKLKDDRKLKDERNWKIFLYGNSHGK